MSGTSLSQAIPILLSPIISRIYTPDEIGGFAYIISIATILSIIFSAKLEQAIPLPNDEEKANILFISSILSSSILSLILLGIILLFLRPLNEFFNFKYNNYNLIFLPFIVFFLNLIQSFNYINNRDKNFRNIATPSVVRTSFNVTLQIFLNSLNTIGLFISDLSSRIISILYQVFSTNQISRRFQDFRLHSKIQIKSVLKEYKNFPLYTMPNALMNSISNNLPILLIKRFFSEKETGYYSWSMKIIQLPMSFIVNSYYQVLYKELSERRSNDDVLFPYIKRTYLQLFALGIIPYSIIFIFAPSIFKIVFGDQWIQAGYYTRYLIPWLFLIFLNSPISCVILVLNKQKEYLSYEFILLFSRFFILLLGFTFFKEIKPTLILYGLAGVIFNLFLLYYFVNISKE